MESRSPVHVSDREAEPAPDPLATRLRRLTALDEGEIDSILDLYVGTFVVKPKRDFLGERGSGHLHVLLDGWACKYKMGHDGRRRIAMLYLPGDILDLDRLYLSTLDSQFSTFAGCEIARLDRMGMLEIFGRNLKIAHTLAALAIDENRRLAENVNSLAARSARERLCHLICEIIVRMQIVGRSDGVCVEWPLIQEQVAEIIGLTSVHLNRVLQEVRAEGLIEWKGCGLRVLDWGRMAVLADFDPAYLGSGQPDPVLRGVFAQLPGRRRIDGPNDSETSDLSGIARSEIAHRMKNLFGMAQALVAQSLKDDARETIGDLRERLLARLHALGQAAEELAENDWSEGSLNSAIQKTLSIYRGTGRIDCSGPDIRLGGQSLLAIVLALHELQTNATKHGALSSIEGRVKLVWTVLEGESGKKLWMQWSEHGGPATRRPTRQGFGTRILTSATPRALMGDARLDYGPDGCKWSLTAPLAALAPERG